MTQSASAKRFLAIFISSCFLMLCAIRPSLRAGAQATPKAETYYYFVFSNPVPGKEDQYNTWYDKQHIRDVVAVPGFLSAQRYVFADDQLRRVPLIKPKYLVIYKIQTSNLAAVSAEVVRRLSSGETRIDSSFDPASFQSAVYRIFRPTQKGVGGEPADAHPGPLHTYAQVVFGDSMEGQDEAFNKWYDEVHEPELLSTPGFLSGDRGILSDVQMGETRSRSRYLAMFAMSSTDLSAVLKGTTLKSPLSPAFDTTRTFGYTYKAIGPTVLGDDVRAERAAAKK